ncbi:MAG: TlpA family protein disulfide reductase [Pirellulales bacterium]|nr:TlpA family protein disulfide reductase [Pirellulales bacterium]
MFLVAVLAAPLRAADDAEPSKPAAETETTAVDYTIVDGEPDAMLEGMRKLATQRPKGANRDEMIADFKKIQSAISQAADKLVVPDANPEIVLQVIPLKVQALGMLARFGDSEAAGQLASVLKDWVDPRLSDAKPEVSAALVPVKLQALGLLAQLRQEGAAAQLVEFIRGPLVEYLDKQPLNQQLAGLAMSAAQTLEYSGKTEEAGAAYREFAGRFAKSDDPAVRSQAERLEACARRMSLPGNFMDISGTTVDGKPFDWSSYRGRVVLVDFWATWCGPCIGELPNVKKNYELYHDRGFDVVGISLDTERADLENFIKDKQLPWVCLFSDDANHNGWNHPMAVHYGINAIPAVLLVDKDGKVIEMNARGEKLGEALQRLLGPPAAAADSDKGK